MLCLRKNPEHKLTFSNFRRRPTASLTLILAALFLPEGWGAGQTSKQSLDGSEEKTVCLQYQIMTSEISTGNILAQKSVESEKTPKTNQMFINLVLIYTDMALKDMPHS